MEGCWRTLSHIVYNDNDKLKRSFDDMTFSGMRNSWNLMHSADINVHKPPRLISYKLLISDFISFLKFWKWNIFLDVTSNATETSNVRKTKHIWNLNRTQTTNKIESNSIYFIRLLKSYQGIQNKLLIRINCKYVSCLKNK